MADVGFGIVGLGRMGALHAEHLAGSIRGARLVEAAVDSEHRRRLLASGGAPCPLADDVDTLVANPDVEALVIASSSSVHPEHIALAARAGKPVFCEKPLAESVAASRAAAETVTAAGIPFQIGFQRRYDAGYARAKDLVLAGAVGEPEMFRGMSFDRIPPVAYLRSSGGLFRDLAVHDFDAARFLMGGEIASVHAVGAIMVEPRLAEFDDVDYGIVALRFRDGALGVVQCGWRAPAGYDIRAEVHGSLGKVITEVDEQFPAQLYTAEGRTSSRHHEFVERFRDAYRAELQAFVDALNAGRAPSPGIEDALAAVLVADAATRSRLEDRWVEIEG